MPDVVMRVNRVGQGQLLVDGHDVSAAVRGVTVKVVVGEEPLLTIDLGGADVQLDAKDVQVVAAPVSEAAS